MNNHILHWQRIMRISILIYSVLLSFSQLLLAGNSKSQTLSKPVSVSMERQTLDEAIQLLGHIAKVDFAYDTKGLGMETVWVSPADYQHEPLENVLAQLLAGTGIAYKEEVRGTVTLYKQQQPGRIAGRVTDGQGEPLAGATVKITELNRTTLTDGEGNFSISVQPGAYSVEVTYIAYGTQRKEVTLQAGQQVEIGFVMRDAEGALSEVVVVGYGTQKKATLTGAITVADMDKLANRPITTTSQALQGMNGLYVNQNTGQPGNDQATIRIRGVGTLNNNDPLVLVDGISYPMIDINPNEIESISVLKDAASTAVYGSRAANGVILITTKAGKRGAGYKVDYNNYFGIEEAIQLPDVEFDPIKFMRYKNIALANEGKAPEYTDAEIAEYEQGMATDPHGYMYPRTNPYEIALKNGFMHEHNITVSGGGDKHNLALTLGALNQDGILKYDKSKASKYSLGLNGKVDVTDFLSIGAKLSGIYRKYDEPQITMGSYWDQAMFRTVPIYPVLIEDGRYGNTWLRSTGLNNWANPLARLREGSRDYVRTRILGNVFADLKLPQNITYRVNLAANTYDYIQHVFQPYLENVNPKTLVPFVASNTTRGYRRYEKELNLTGFHTLDWHTSIAGKHNVNVLLGNSVETFSWEYFNAQKDGSMDNQLTDMDVFLTNPSVAGNSTRSALLSYFGRLNYNFDEKYLLEVNFRSDGSSRFAKAHRWGLFPSFSVGWRMDKESFMQDIEWIDGLKPRFSWGKIGNQEIALWSYVNSVGLNQNYSFGNTESIGAAATAMADPELSWETTTMSNIGVDISLFKGRLNTTVEWYNKDADGILRPINYASQVGNMAGPTTNVGSVNNRGIEVILNYRDTKGAVSYEIGGSFAYNKNRVTNLNGQQIISGRYITTEGHPIQSYYIYEAEGIFQSEEEIANHAFQNAATRVGFLKYKDQNGDNVINADDRKIVHGVVPEYTYSFNLGAGYKGFQVLAFFQGVGKVFTYPQSNLAYPYYNGAGVTKEWLTDSWTPENPDARLPILTTSTGNTLNFENSTFWLQNAAYLRLKNLQVSYTIPTHLAQKMSMKAVRIFVNGQNLLTFTDMKITDPEKNLTQDNIFAYPQVKTYSAGVNITF
ncbi:SusC/RagA family TonB-linked outer membrane protein [Parapedobacter sp. ISTM3]|uniref:SusC/RagA family TonB-linked outer membrane protein n=1 Tax=Parapedobacter sp. ISTM3 TaxID=2800130 RepID=UPI001902F75E|nr:SusC/RagA family TonB-linked outer membrane protein [Parapedobacter sp. ISTM3]MBK1438893.1 SusC/RagA family TonB-linked outer membrane protein [Parapedobacter sp. ISTM3]